jgi:hypothetical protein
MTRVARPTCNGSGRRTTQHRRQQAHRGAQPGGQVAVVVLGGNVAVLAGDQHPGQPRVAGQPPRGLGG